MKIPMSIKCSRKDPVMRKEYNRVWRNKYNNATASIKRKLSTYVYQDKQYFSTVCDYTYDELLYTLSTNRCTYCGNINDLGLDRLDNSKGHTKDNTVVCCKLCNSLRGNTYTSEEMQLITKLLYQKRTIEDEIRKVIRNHRQKV